MKHLVVRCVGNGEVATVEIRFNVIGHEIHLAELIPTQDPMIQRRVNRETLHPDEYPELWEVVAGDPRLLLLYEALEWQMTNTEALVLGYLNRRSEARVQLSAAWKTELVNAPDGVSDKTS